MKDQTLTFVILTALAFTAGHAGACIGTCRTYPSGPLYVTQIDKCWEFYDSLTGKPQAIVGLYLNQKKGDYVPNDDLRAYVTVDHCDEMVDWKAKNLIGKLIMVNLKSSRYGLNWDPDIEASSMEEVAATVVDPTGAIRFNGTTEANGYLTLTVNGSADDGTTIAGDANGQRRFVINRQISQLEYFNSAGASAFKQTLNCDELDRLTKTLKALSSCPLTVTIDRALRRVVRVSSGCVDLSLALANSAAG